MQSLANPIHFAISLSCLTFTGAAGAELLTNPGFENGTSGWVGRNCSIAAESTKVHTGNGAVHVFNRTKNWQSVRQDIRSLLLANGPGDYTFSAAARAETGFAGTAKIKFVIVDSGNTSALNTPFTISDAGWTNIAGTRTIDWTGTLDEAYFEIPHDTPTAEYFVDDGSLGPVEIGADLPPFFFSDPTAEAQAVADIPYAATLIDDCYDPDGDALTFTAPTLPAWLALAPDGDLSGTPAPADVGLHSFAVEVSDGGGTNAQTTVQINVLPTPTPLPLPYQETFELNLPYSPLTRAAGWHTENTMQPAVIPHTSGVPPPAFPFAVPHHQVLDLHQTTRPALAWPVAPATIRVDTLVQPALRTDPAPPTTEPSTHCALYVSEAGYLTVLHKVYNSAFTSATMTWSALDHPPVTPGQWVRLTIRVDYQTDTLRNHAFFSVSLDTTPLSHPSAYQAPGPTDLNTDTNGTWFLCATSGPGTPPIGFSGLAFNGRSRLDDCSVSDPTRYTSHGTPFGWLDEFYPAGDYEQLDQSDSDGDGMRAWQEYRAGTDPTRQGSVFTAAFQPLPTGGHRLTWPGSLTGSLAAYRIYRTTNLVDALSWVNVAGPIVRDLSGTNEWVDVSPPASPSAFYQVRIPGQQP